MNCLCDSVTTLKDNDAALYKREHLVAMAIDANEWEGLYRCKVCGTLFEETFEEDRFGGIPILNKVDEDYIKNKWGIDLDCTNCGDWEEIHGFYSILEYERFLKHVEDWLKTASLTEIPVGTYCAGFQKQWFECNQCSQAWELVHPDFPFDGLWVRVCKQERSQ